MRVFGNRVTTTCVVPFRLVTVVVVITAPKSNTTRLPNGSCRAVVCSKVIAVGVSGVCARHGTEIINTRMVAFSSRMGASEAAELIAGTTRDEHARFRKSGQPAVCMVVREYQILGFRRSFAESGERS